VKDISFVSDLQDLWPRVAMNTQQVFVDKQTTSTDSNLHVISIRILYTPHTAQQPQQPTVNQSIN